MTNPRAESKKWKDLKGRMSEESRARVDARVEQTLRAMPLAEIRKAVGQTQQELAKALDVAQGSVSKFENATDMYLSTLRKYVRALGGELSLSVTFEDGRRMEISQVSDRASA